MRASVSIPPTASCLDCTFRIYRKQRTTFTDLIEWDALTVPGGELLGGAASWPDDQELVAGEPGSGKSTFMAASIAATPSTTNVRITQKYRELFTDQHTGGDWMAGPAGKTLRDLTVAQLNFAPRPGGDRQRRLGAEAYELIRAANSGCGFITTVHSLSADRGDEHLGGRGADRARRRTRRPSCAARSPA